MMTCREAIERCRLEEPVVCEPFTIVFDPWELEKVRDTFGLDSYREAMMDAEKEGANGKV